MKSLRERLAEPHFGVLFPRAIEELSHVEKEAELLECGRALALNVWQTIGQMEDVLARSEALLKALEPPEQPFLHVPLNGDSGFSLLKK